MKSTFYLFAFLTFAIADNLCAQAPQWVWAKSAGGAGSDYGNSIAVDSSGNTYVTGSFNSPTITFGSSVLTLSGTSDVFVVKYDSGGNAIWAKSFGSNADNVGTGIATDKAGNIYATGYFRSNSITIGSFTLTNDTTNSSADIFIVKYTSAGNVIWAKSFGGSYSDFANAISVDAAANVSITGEYNSPSLAFGSTTLAGTIQPKLFVTKMDSAGNVSWAKTAFESSYGLTIASSVGGAVYVSGALNDTTLTLGNDTLRNTDINANTPDVFVVKYDNSGNVVWARQAGGTDDDETSGIVADSAGNVYLSGNFWSHSMIFGTIILSNQNTGGSDYFLAKYDANGNVQWAKGVTGQYSWASSITAGANGDVYVTGQFADTALLFAPFVLKGDPNFSNLFVAGYDQNGNGKWAIGGLGFDSQDYPTAIATNGSNNIYITGYFGDSTLIFANDTLFNDTTDYSDDIFVSKMSAPLISSTEMTNKPLKKIDVYPNPTDGVFTISLNENRNNEITPAQVSITNMMGQKIYYDTFFGNRTTINCQFGAGIYFVQVKNGSELWTEKIVKE